MFFFLFIFTVIYFILLWRVGWSHQRISSILTNTSLQFSWKRKSIFKNSQKGSILPWISTNSSYENPSKWTQGSLQTDLLFSWKKDKGCNCHSQFKILLPTHASHLYHPPIPHLNTLITGLTAIREAPSRGLKHSRTHRVGVWRRSEERSCFLCSLQFWAGSSLRCSHLAGYSSLKDALNGSRYHLIGIAEGRQYECWAMPPLFFWPHQLHRTRRSGKCMHVYWLYTTERCPSARALLSFFLSCWWEFV